MQSLERAANAYAAASAHRSLREQEADVFRGVNAGLRRARDKRTQIALVRALADNDRLWMAVIDVARDDSNALPVEIRASLVSIGLAVRRDMARDHPDLDFLISVNDNIAAGLSGMM